MSYTLLQIAQRITLAKDDASFRQLFAYSVRFGAVNALLAALVVIVVMLFSDKAAEPQTLSFVAWLTAGNLANYFAQVCFSNCDYTFDYKSFGISSALSNVLSLALAVAVFAFGGGIFSMVLRDVARGVILLGLALYSTSTLLSQLREAIPLCRKSRLAFFGFLMKRHTLKVIEVSNHRVPALMISTGKLNSLGQFGVAFQLISQIMNVLTIAGDRLAYAFFSRGERESKLKYLAAVVGIYAMAGLTIFLFGERLFALIYGKRWLDSARTFSYLGLYLFTHGTLVVVTNYLITEQRFAGIYLSWGGWTTTFVACYFFNRSWPIVTYYLMASAASFVLVLSILFVGRYRRRAPSLV